MSAQINSERTGSGLFLCDLGVLRWQSCDNSYNWSQYITLTNFSSSHKLKKIRTYTLKKEKFSFFFFKTVFFI